MINWLVGLLVGLVMDLVAMGVRVTRAQSVIITLGPIAFHVFGR